MATYNNVHEPQRRYVERKELFSKSSICMIPFIEEFQHLSVVRDQG